MGISRLTAYTIANRTDIVIDAGGPDENGKWAGWITLGEADRFRPLLSTQPVYDSKEAAIAEMRETVKAIKEEIAKEQGDRDPIQAIMEDSGMKQDQIDAVKEVVRLSKE